MNAVSVPRPSVRHSTLSSTEEIIDEARNGRMYILVDEDRENEGDLVIPAQMITPSAVDFMATHGRGPIGLGITQTRAEGLGLPPTVRDDEKGRDTAFPKSIGAKESFTRDISAADRARTIAAAIDARNGADKSPSLDHVFPLVAQAGGVLIRTGHTEAAVDVSRLAGLNPSAVICEVMTGDDTTARLDDLVTLARRHDLKIGTVRDLIAYRLRHDPNLVQTGEASFASRYGGDWRAVSFRNKATSEEVLVLTKGRIDPMIPTLVRIHAISIFADVLGEMSLRSGLIEGAMKQINEIGTGVVVLTDRGPDTLSAIVRARSGLKPGDPMNDELRDFGNVAQVLAALDVRNVILLTNTHHAMIGLGGYDLNVVEERPISGPR